MLAIACWIGLVWLFSTTAAFNMLCALLLLLLLHCCSLVPAMTQFGKKFTFEPDAGHLAGGEIQIIRIKLNSDILGTFNETFEWSIKGSSTPLTLQLKGQVAGPTYELDTSVLDFGVVSYGFR